MSERLTKEGYEQTKRKLSQLEQRLKAIDGRTDLDSDRLAEVKRSYQMMIRQYRHDIKLYDAVEAHSDAGPVTEQN